MRARGVLDISALRPVMRADGILMVVTLREMMSVPLLLATVVTGIVQKKSLLAVSL